MANVNVMVMVEIRQRVPHSAATYLPPLNPTCLPYLRPLICALELGIGEPARKVVFQVAGSGISLAKQRRRR